MDNIYLIYGDEEFLIDKEIKNIINKFNSSMENVARYNLDESNVREAIEDACTISMFETNKIVICEKCNFLTGENKKEINHDIDSLIKYINNPFSDSVLIFVVRNPKLDERKKVVKELKKCSKVIECKTIENYNLNNYISNYFKTNNYEISQSDVKLIIDATNVYSRKSKIKELRSAGVPVKVENYAGKMHSKSIIIDDEYIVAGSMNFSNSGENKNDENVLIIENKTLARYYKGFFEYLWKKIPEKYLQHGVRPEGKFSIGSCSDGIDNNYDGNIDKDDIGCK